MPSGVYQLPDMLSVCPKRTGPAISPGFKKAKDGYEQWVRDTIGYFVSKGVANAEMPLLAALAWPEASSKELRAILDYMTMSFMLEELTDRCSSEVAQKISELWVDVLKDPQAGKGHRQMVARLKDAVDPYHWPEFIQSNAEFAKNTIQEALDREASKDIAATRCIASYMIMRRETVGTRPCFVLIRSTRRLYLPEHVLQHPVVADMENSALDMVYLANDIYSFKKERGDNGALNNIITVIQKDPTTQHLDLQDRFDHAGKLFQVALDRFNACRDALPSFGDEGGDKQVAAFADGLVDWIRGSIEWSMVNHRYRVFVNDDDRRENILRLDDRWSMSAVFQLLLLFTSIVVACISLKFLIV
ncbi:isoprenoid synthase domain-containing protein [Suillus paluster]|uniref:isoprenoid synthase domain-containing protein n=1 Tax=Suillus paluster TaxID=48578 RepID=UPI001B8738B2|nr:isoprenoid synthase domain-containing protein [Suillus paluster]KAG1754774.1 isoprenoid synthase domain-containing protein [Suillus paluster]